MSENSPDGQCASTSDEGRFYASPLGGGATRCVTTAGGAYPSTEDVNVLQAAEPIPALSGTVPRGQPHSHA